MIEQLKRIIFIQKFSHSEHILKPMVHQFLRNIPCYAGAKHLNTYLKTFCVPARHVLPKRSQRRQTWTETLRSVSTASTDLWRNGQQCLDFATSQFKNQILMSVKFKLFLHWLTGACWRSVLTLLSAASWWTSRRPSSPRWLWRRCSPWTGCCPSIWSGSRRCPVDPSRSPSSYTVSIYNLTKLSLSNLSLLPLTLHRLLNF